MIVYKEIKNEVALIIPHGTLMGGSGTKVLDKVLLDIESNYVKKCIVDCADVKCVNSRGLDCLIKRKNNFRKSGKILQIVNFNA